MPELRFHKHFFMYINFLKKEVWQNVLIGAFEKPSMDSEFMYLLFDINLSIT